MQLMSNKKIAYVLTVFAYREAGNWEDYHAQKRILDMSVYDEMCRSVKVQLSIFLPYIKYLRMSVDEWLDQGSTLSQEQQDYMLGFVFISRSSHEWISAKTINEPIGDDLAEYMLEGRFKAACENGEQLNNDVIMQINIDVHNRVYTLIENGRI